MMLSSPPSLHYISTTAVKPPLPLPPNRSCYLNSWDLCTLSMEYIQNGLLFPTPIPSLPAVDLAGLLQTSLSLALLHFRPLAGRLASSPSPDGSGTLVSIACTDQGAEFSFAVAPDVSVADVLSPDVPSFLRSLFPLNGTVNYDGCSRPLVAVQLTELADGLFLACSFNHAAGDGTSYWSFLNAWANISRGCGAGSPSPPPIFDRWFGDGQKAPIELPFAHPDQFIERLPQAGSWRERVFHFSPESVATLKSIANSERGGGAGAPISSFQSVASLLWRSVTRARGVPAERETRCRVAINNRPRIRPALTPEYFGGAVDVVEAAAPAGELLERALGWGARRVHEAVEAHTDGAVRQGVEEWMVAPYMYNLTEDRVGLKMGSSARFRVYESDFGWGRPVAVRSGSANKYVGKVTFHPGREGGGSMDTEVCLEPEAMEALIRDAEFAGALFSYPTLTSRRLG